MEHSKVNITCLPVNPAWRITFLGLRLSIDLKNWHFWSLFLPELILLTTRAIWPIGNTKLLAITAGILYKNIQTYFLHCETSAQIHRLASGGGQSRDHRNQIFARRAFTDPPIWPHNFLRLPVPTQGSGMFLRAQGNARIHHEPVNANYKARFASF